MIFTTFFVYVAYGHCDTLCTSGFVDDIMFFFYNGPYSSMNFPMNDRFCLNLLISHKVEQKSISYY